MSTIEISSWIVAIATLLAVMVALFKEGIIGLWRCPKLFATIRTVAPDCLKTVMTISNPRTGEIIAQGNCFYLRLWVENKGNLRAEQVQVYAAKLLRRHADETFREEKQFQPMNLKWSHSQPMPIGPEIFARGISPSMGKHCDLGHILDSDLRTKTGETLPNVPNDQTILALDTEVVPNTLSHLIVPGIYRLELKIAAANSKPVTRVIEINLTGKWYEDESKMFADGIGLKEIK